MLFKIYVLMAMLFCHIVDDYYLQGWLASAKQMDWWKKNAPEPLYKNDYKMALLMHGLSWSFMVLVPVALFSRLSISIDFVVFFAGNAAIHCIVDNLKANLKAINLIEDQTFHIFQILIAWIVLVVLVQKMDYRYLIDQLRRVVEHGDEDPREYCTNMCGGCEMCDQAADAIETLQTERDAAINLLRKTNWCAGCVHLNSLRGCSDGSASVCCVEDDHYQFGIRAKKGENDE